MNKKFLSIIVGSIILGSAALFLFLGKRGDQKEIIAPALVEDPVPDAPSTYKHPAGFTFDYPSSFTAAQDTKDEENYANINITKDEITGSMNILISGTKFKSLDAWLAKQNVLEKKDGKKITLGDLDALEFKTGDSIKLVAVGIDVIYTVTVDFGEDKRAWEEAYDTVITSFQFVDPEEFTDSTPEKPQETGQSIPAQNDIILEEEIIE